MSELNIKVRKSQDNGSTFRATPDTLYMGGVGSAKVDTLHFEVPEEWAGCAITLHVQRLSGALPDPQMLDENNCVVVDRRWTQEKQGSWMLLAVDENGYIAMTKPGQYTCYETIDTNSTTETITPSVYEQFVAAVEKWGQTAVDAAAKAKGSEENAADSASASAGSAAAAARSESAAAGSATAASGSASAADRAKTDAQTAAQQSEASAKKAGKALSDTITAKEDALKAIGDKQTTATQAVDTARDKALRQVESSTEAAQTAATQAVDTARDKALQQVKASTEAAQTAATQAVDTARDKALQQVKASTEAAQTTATQAVDTARDKALQQVEASTEAAKTAASEAAASAGNADRSAQEAADSLQELKDGIAAGNFKGKPGKDGESPVIAVTDIENGHRISITDKDGTKAIDVLDGKDGKDAPQIDDTTVTDSAPWSSKHIVDMLCPPLEETGNPVQCYPVAGYPLGVKAKWEPAQDGSGTPYPAGGGKNLWGDLLQDTFVSQQGLSSGYSGAKTTGKIPCTEGDNYTLSCAITFSPAPGNIGVLAYFDASDTMLTRIANTYQRAFTLTAPANAAYLRASCYQETDADNVQLEKGSVATAYAPYENIRPIKGRDSVRVERCGENLLNTSQLKPERYNLAGSNILKPNTTYTFKPVGCGGIAFAVFLTDNIVPSQTTKQLNLTSKYIEEGKSATFTTPSNADSYSVMWLAGGKRGIDQVYPNVEFMLVAGTTAPTAYAPYTGQTSTLTLPHTIYGGTVDAVSGGGKETWKLRTLDGTEPWNTWGLNANNPAVTGFYTYDIKDYDNINTKGICSHSAATGQDVWGGRAAGIGFASVGSTPYFIYSIPTSLLPDISAGHEVATFKAYLAAQYAAGTPVQVCYKLAEPAPFTSTGAQPIPALSGVNTVITDADSATATGRADPIKRITDLEDAVASMT